MSESLPPLPLPTKRELLESPEQWRIAAVGNSHVAYVDQRGRTLVLPICDAPKESGILMESAHDKEAEGRR
jgi:hypothetical protein